MRFLILALFASTISFNAIALADSGEPCYELYPYESYPDEVERQQYIDGCLKSYGISSAESTETTDESEMNDNEQANTSVEFEKSIDEILKAQAEI